VEVDTGRGDGKLKRHGDSALTRSQAASWSVYQCKRAGLPTTVSVLVPALLLGGLRRFGGRDRGAALATR
jgi:hypothetical protein